MNRRPVSPWPQVGYESDFAPEDKVTTILSMVETKVSITKILDQVDLEPDYDEDEGLAPVCPHCGRRHW
jgi:hypothetical protein